MSEQFIHDSPGRLLSRRFISYGTARWSLALLGLFCALSAFAPLLTSYERDAVDLEKRNLPPSREHWLGTDLNGRDVYTRLLYGGRVSLAVGFLSALLSILVGVPLGLLSGFLGSWIDSLIMYLVDILLSFPYFVIAIVFALIFGKGFFNLVVIAGLLGCPALIRIIRAEVLSLRHREFVEAAHSLGLKTWRILFHYLLPNLLGPIVVYATLAVSTGILAEAALSFLGLGIEIPTPSWGEMLSTAQSFITVMIRWWQWLPPGLCVFLTVLSTNFVGEALRDAADVKL